MALASLGLRCTGLKDGGTMPPSMTHPGSPDGAPRDAATLESAIPTEDAPTDAGVAAEALEEAGDSNGLRSIADAEAETLAPAPPSPAMIAPSQLRLWLNAAAGIMCVQNRVSAWLDSSSDHRDATLQHGQRGPECQLIPAPHVVDGVDLPYFSGPETADAASMLDETLDVDFTFLKQSDYTIFVVERRWADDSPLTNQSAFVLGTTIPPAVVEAGVGCSNQGAHDVALAIGYVYYHGSPQFVEDQSCSALYDNSVPAPVVQPNENLLVEHAIRFDSSQGHQIWTQGTLVSSNSYITPAGAAQGGAIGRAFLDAYSPSQDQRFRGDIAEIIVYNAALSDADLIAVEIYLQAHWKY
jgi:hypothetical protein